MRVYPALKIFCLLLMFSSYILLLFTIVAANTNEGWIVVTVNRYGEGHAEAVLLSVLLPLAGYVTVRETLDAFRSLGYRK